MNPQMTASGPYHLMVTVPERTETVIEHVPKPPVDNMRPIRPPTAAEDTNGAGKLYVRC